MEESSARSVAASVEDLVNPANRIEGAKQFSVLKTRRESER